MKQESRREITHLMLERMINIHKEIKSGSYPNSKQLAEKFNEGKGIATISRDIEFLKYRFDAPIEYDYTKRGYYYTEDYDMPLNNIPSDNLITLTAAKQLLSHFKNTPIYDDISNVINLLMQSFSLSSSNFMERIALPPTTQCQVDDKIWPVIFDALKKNTKIEFDYSGRWNTQITHRKVHPYQLVMDDGKYFLFGYSEERQEVRLFSLSRIINLEETDETFILPDNYDFESHCGGGKFGSFSSNQSEKYKIEFYENARQMVKECIWADDQFLEDDESRDCTTITFTSTQFLKIEEWILSQGCYAKPLEPEWLVQEWKEHIHEMLKLCES